MTHKFTTKDPEEARRIIKSRELAMALWDITHNGLRGREEYTAEEFMGYIYGLLDEYGIVIDDLIT